MPRLLYRIISACCLCLPLPSLAAESLDESALMVVTSADGHANVRTRPSTTAPVSARLPTATVLFRNDAEFNTTAHDTWYPVVFAQDAWCRGCDDTWTNTDSGHARRAELAVFIQHFERITRHMLAGGVRADLVFQLDADRRLSPPASGRS